MKHWLSQRSHSPNSGHSHWASMLEWHFAIYPTLGKTALLFLSIHILMRNPIKYLITSILIATLAAIAPAMAEDQNTNWEAQVRKVDEAYWHEFNFGPSASLNFHLAKDVEFYHDLGGIELGYDALAKVNAGMDSIKNRARRVLVPDTLRIFPMRRGADVYGAIVMGDHDFFRTESGEIVKKWSRSSFTHLMLRKDGVWKIARIYSYNHQLVTGAK